MTIKKIVPRSARNNAKPKKGSVMAFDANPGIMDWWNAEKNGNADPHNITAGSKEKYYFNCPECGTEMFRNMYWFFTKNGDGTYSLPVCQKCHPTKSSKRVKLTDAVPDIERYWNYDLNEGKRPEDFGASGSTKVWTNCPICGTPVLRNIRFSWVKDENGVGHVMHCRTCGKRNESNSLVDLFPEIREVWLERNEHGPEYYPINSGQKAYFKCPRCGKERLVAICDAVQKTDDGYRLAVCSDCQHDIADATKRGGRNNVLDNVPDIEQYWDDRNTYRPEDMSLFSTEKIYTHCPSCGKLLKRRAYNSFVQNADGTYSVLRCQQCGATASGAERAMEQSGPLIDECPEILEWWDAGNTIPIENLTRGSHYVANLKCPACGIRIQRDIHSVIGIRRDGRVLPVACPECGYSSEGDPEDNMLKLCPSITDWWDYQANYPYKPEQFRVGSTFRAHLRCPDCGMELFTSVSGLLRRDSSGNVIIRHQGKCRKYRAMASDLNLVKKYPEVRDWWDYDKNEGEVPEEYTLHSQKRVHFRCPVCGKESFSRICDAFNLTENGTPNLFNCSVCNNKRVLPGYNSLLATNPELAAEWSPNNELSADEVLPGLWRRYLWICPECGGEYSAQMCNREVGDDACPYCRKRWVLPGYNSLLAVNPDLASEWDPNNDMTADEVMPTSWLRVSWICPTCNGAYTAQVKDREVGDDACPYCRDQKVLPGYNSLAVRAPDLVENEWCEIENILIQVDPDHVLTTSNQKVWWKCPTCEGKYMMSISDRMMKRKRGHVACQQCRGRRWIRRFTI